MPCDTFVYVGHGYTIFGKNSDRPEDEIQPVQVYSVSPRDSSAKNIRCTYIDIDLERILSLKQHKQPAQTLVALCQPVWMYGAEIGANSHGVVIGNEAVWTRLPTISTNTALLGMDLLRLGLEYSTSAKHALDIITTLLEVYNQGGSCSQDPDSHWTYHNSFIIADYHEAWVLETAGQVWVAQSVLPGQARSISNNLSIHTNYELHSANLFEQARKLGWAHSEKSQHALDFAAIFSNDCSPDQRELCGRRLLEDVVQANDNQMRVQDMMDVLRNHQGSICMHGGFASTASQVSILRPDSARDVHWFTGTSNPCSSVYKPISLHRVSWSSQRGSKASHLTDGQTLWLQHKKGVMDAWVHDKARTQEITKRQKELEAELLQLVESKQAGGTTDMDIGLVVYQESLQKELQLYGLYE